MPRSIKRQRRSKAEIAAIRERIYEIAREYEPLTCRQCFYLLVARNVIEKTDREYKGTVIRLLTQMREQRVIPFDWIVDNTRWIRKPRTYGSMAAALEQMSRHYRRDLWAGQDVYVEVWAESDSVAGIIVDVTAEFDVPLMVCRGYASTTFLYSAAEAIEDTDKPAYLYQVVDHDPSGVDIARDVEDRLRRWASGADIQFQRIAVTPQQIEAWDLPGRPTKPTDTRARNFQGESVEVEAIEPERLREIVRSSIEQHIDRRLLERTRRVERVERLTLSRLIENLPNVPGSVTGLEL